MSFTALESLGLFWLIGTAVFSHVLILVAAYKHIRRTLDLAHDAEAQESRDVRNARIEGVSIR